MILIIGVEETFLTIINDITQSSVTRPVTSTHYISHHPLWLTPMHTQPSPKLSAISLISFSIKANTKNTCGSGHIVLGWTWTWLPSCGLPVWSYLELSSLQSSVIISSSSQPVFLSPVISTYNRQEQSFSYQFHHNYLQYRDSPAAILCVIQ